MAVRTVPVTCCIDYQSHEVADTELAVGEGYYRALCGHLIAAAPMIMPDGEPCKLCAAVPDPNSPRRRGLLRRIFG